MEIIYKKTSQIKLRIPNEFINRKLLNVCLDILKHI